MQYEHIYFRTPRRWMSNLAENLGCQFVKQEKVMFSKPRTMLGKFKIYLFELYKSSPLPPLEWWLPYHFYNNYNQSTSLVVDCGSKLINSRVKYISYIENGLGLFSFNTRKINRLNAYILRKKIESETFEGFVFYSESAKLSTENLLKKLGCLDAAKPKFIKVISPYTSKVSTAHRERNKLNRWLFCSSSFSLKGGREVVDLYLRLKFKYDLSLTVVTDLVNLPREYNIPGISYKNFNLSDVEWENLMLSHDLLCHPTYFDTHALVVLESISRGMNVMCTNTFALPEFLESNKHILVRNPFNPYTDQFLPKFNGLALKHAEKLSKSKMSSEMVDDMERQFSEYFNSFRSSNHSIPTKLAPEQVIKDWHSVLSPYSIES